MLLCLCSSSGGGPSDSTAEDGGGGIAESVRERDEGADVRPPESRPLVLRSFIVSCSRASIFRLLIAPVGTGGMELCVPGSELGNGER